MNIDYAAIIQKANERKDALQKFEGAVTNLRAEINESGSPELITALYEYKIKYEALDAEAINMLPENAGHVLVVFANDMMAVWNRLLQCSAWIKITPYEALEQLSQE